ncbi:hypothetical protein EJB05_52908, partial [Eragrostis curvula]
MGGSLKKPGVSWTAEMGWNTRTPLDATFRRRHGQASHPPLPLLAHPHHTGQLRSKLIDCPSNTNYTRGSAFQANLDALLSSIPGTVAASSSGFTENVTGAAPDQAYGLAQCRADVNASDCLACLDAAVRDMATWCPGQKSATLVYDDEVCLLRYSNASFSGAGDTSVVWYKSNSQNATQPAQFTSSLSALMKNLTATAAYSSPRKFAAGSAALAPFENIYGIAQCTLDVSADDCNRCLVSAVATIPTCCNEKLGGRVIYRTCSIRFEMYPFYNVSAAEAAMSPAPSPGGGPINGIDHSVPGSTGSKRTVRRAPVVSIPVAVMLLLLLLVALYLCKRNRKPHENAQIASVRHGDDEEMRSPESLLYDLSTLRAATDNFSEENKLGEGGFGPVYKGILQDGQEIALKRLSTTSQQGQVEMKNEVFLVAKLQHKNLVRVLGCCIQEHERLLVYEFLVNNSLDKILFDLARQHELSWEQRHKIIEGIGRGLLYLHEDSRLKIIHRDLKASNILLDKDMNPKISDFGLAKLFNVDSSVGNTSRVAGTYGYMAPEYALHGIFSAKSDVFSYGVLVLEIVTGRRHEEDEEMRSSETLLYDLSTLRAATDKFSEENKLGEGGFGPVYKEIAVKRLSTTSQQGQVEMKNEVFLVAKLQHKNLVRILGCCIQEHERLLVYEFLSNNSLDKILFDPARQHELSWEQRHKIIEGIGRGLLYLHEDSRLKIIHRDLKAGNILLDKDMNPKISDFGLAKLFSVDSSVGNTSHIAGTYGYMAPEYALHGIFSAKSDVFSYGVLVLEIVTGRRNSYTQASVPSEDLLTFVWRRWSRGSVQELLDGCPAGGRHPQEVLRCVHVGLLCVQEDPLLRPGMAAIIIMLNSRSITLPAPIAPAFVDVTAVDARGRSTDHEGLRAAAREQSINEASISNLEPQIEASLIDGSGTATVGLSFGTAKTGSRHGPAVDHEDDGCNEGSELWVVLNAEQRNMDAPQHLLLPTLIGHAAVEQRQHVPLVPVHPNLP